MTDQPCSVGKAPADFESTVHERMVLTLGYERSWPKFGGQLAGKVPCSFVSRTRILSNCSQTMLTPLAGLEHLREVGVANLGCLASKHSRVDGIPFKLPCRILDEHWDNMRDYLQKSGVVHVIGQVCPLVNVVRVQCSHVPNPAGLQWTWVRDKDGARPLMFEESDVLPLDLFHYGEAFPSSP